ncbi:uncharacterized protein LOC121863481 [Homarus americanus]|uniref:uncharacterized protein LOC121863481 n=1 Tax=Homarus americanus TaxID=6706 RepID=UPI001C492E6A|nr:uncharacterized protein LOC121863481 [Homarus americanus]
MEKLLRPTRLDIDPNSPTAAKEWKHWHRTFINFIEEYGENAPDKLRTLIFARHLLAKRRQQPGETLDEFLRELRKLSKDCNLKPVTAEQYREELIHDAFINGISSPLIWQRLLENKTLGLQNAYNQAYSLDLAQHNADAYSSPLLHQLYLSNPRQKKSYPMRTIH